VPEEPKNQTDSVILYRVAKVLLEQDADTACGELLAGVLDAAITALKAERGLVLIPENGSFRASIARNFRAATLDKEEAEISTTIANQVFEHRRALLIGNASESPEFRDNPSVRTLSLRSVLCAPLLAEGQVFALLYLENRSIEDCFTEAHRALLEQIALLAAPRLRSALVLEEARGIARNVSELMGEDGMLTADSKMAELLATVKQIAPTELPVLIQGETGTGKELIARSLYRQSRRNKGSYIVMNCGAIPKDLVESELFGHVKGAFTGAAHDRIGLIGAAHRGTVLLDEIGELPLELQPKLLRVLQSGEVMRLGSTRNETYDVRFIAATNRDLQREVEEGRFRSDLYFRIAGAVLHVPPLRDRKQDIFMLASHFLRLYAAQYNRPLPKWGADALAVLGAYSFPGNIRELESECARIIAMRPAEQSALEIRVEELSSQVRGMNAADSGVRSSVKDGMVRNPATPPMSITEMEKQLILTMLGHTDGNRTRAAELLGISREGLRTKMQRYGITDKE